MCSHFEKNLFNPPLSQFSVNVVNLDARHGNFTIAAEVGLLSHNIKVIGESYPEQQEQAFGARVLVGTYTFEGDTFKGLMLIDLTV